MYKLLLTVVTCGALVLGGCGDDDDAVDAADDTSEDAMDEAMDDTADDPSNADMEQDTTMDGPEAGTLAINDEIVTLMAPRCFLEEQEAAAGGGSIELTAQAQGTNAAGEIVRIDFTRFGHESQFAGDDLSIDIGPLGESVSYGGSEPLGTVSLDGSVVSARDFTVTGPDFQEQIISFSIDCG